MDWVLSNYTLAFTCVECVKGDPTEQTKALSGKTSEQAPVLAGMDFSALCTQGISKSALILILCSVGLAVLAAVAGGLFYWRARKRRLKQEQIKLEQETEAKLRLEKKQRKLRGINDTSQKDSFPVVNNQNELKEPSESKLASTSKKTLKSKSPFEKSGRTVINNNPEMAKSATSLDLQQDLEQHKETHEEAQLSVDRSVLSSNSLSPQKGSTKRSGLSRRPIKRVTNNSASKLP